MAISLGIYPIFRQTHVAKMHFAPFPSLALWHPPLVTTLQPCTGHPRAAPGWGMPGRNLYRAGPHSEITIKQ